MELAHKGGRAGHLPLNEMCARFSLQWGIFDKPWDGFGGLLRQCRQKPHGAGDSKKVCFAILFSRHTLHTESLLEKEKIKISQQQRKMELKNEAVNRDKGGGTSGFLRRYGHKTSLNHIVSTCRSDRVYLLIYVLLKKGRME